MKAMIETKASETKAMIRNKGHDQNESQFRFDPGSCILFVLMMALAKKEHKSLFTIATFGSATAEHSIPAGLMISSSATQANNLHAQLEESTYAGYNDMKVVFRVQPLIWPFLANNQRYCADESSTEWHSHHASSNQAKGGTLLDTCRGRNAIQLVHDKNHAARHSHHASSNHAKGGTFLDTCRGRNAIQLVDDKNHAATLASQTCTDGIVATVHAMKDFETLSWPLSSLATCDKIALHGLFSLPYNVLSVMVMKIIRVFVARRRGSSDSMAATACSIKVFPPRRQR